MKPLILLTLITSIFFGAVTPTVTLAQGAVEDTFYEGGGPTVTDGTVTSGGFVPCSGNQCSLCDFAVMANTIIKWLIGILFMFFAILAVIAGFKLVMSGGNPGAKQAAKNSFTNAFIGLFIVLGAWILVDTLLRALLAGGTGEVSGYGPWSEVKCASQVVGTIGTLLVSDPELPPGAPPASSYGTTTANDPGADNVFTYQSGISSQRVHASASLNRLLSCMAGKVPANVGQISSISDHRITSGTRTFSYCRARGNNSPESTACAHTVRSFHYGSGGQCGDKSFAVDFGDENNARALCAAANGCGARDCGVHNGNHVHVSAVLDCN